MVKWSELRYGCTSTTVGLITIQVSWSTNAYRIRVNQRTLNKSFLALEDAKAHAVQQAIKWTQETLTMLTEE